MAGRIERWFAPGEMVVVRLLAAGPLSATQDRISALKRLSPPSFRPLGHSTRQFFAGNRTPMATKMKPTSFACLFAVLAVSLTVTAYQTDAGRWVICEDDNGFVVSGPNGLRDTYGAGFSLNIVRWFYSLPSPLRRPSLTNPAGDQSCVRQEPAPLWPLVASATGASDLTSASAQDTATREAPEK